MGERTRITPNGTVAVSRTEWVDARTGHLLNKHERAAAYVRDFYGRTGEWPAIKCIVYRAGVGSGTAWRAMKSVREAEAVRIKVGSSLK